MRKSLLNFPSLCEGKPYWDQLLVEGLFAFLRIRNYSDQKIIVYAKLVSPICDHSVSINALNSFLASSVFL